jgi:hypothetical protein
MCSRQDGQVVRLHDSHSLDSLISALLDCLTAFIKHRRIERIGCVVHSPVTTFCVHCRALIYKSEPYRDLATIKVKITINQVASSFSTDS